MLTRRSALLSTAALPFISTAGAQQPSTLRIAMTLADIPVTDGAPDQGTEGIRFMGYTLYDPLVAWDLSSATEPAKLVPGLATKWYQDPADPSKWIFELRQGVKFHHGAPFTADDVIFTLDRTLNDKSPAFDRTGRGVLIASVWGVVGYRKIDTYKVATVRNSCSTMHKLGHRPLTEDDFIDREVLPDTLRELNRLGQEYRDGGRRDYDVVRRMKRHLPEGFLQRAGYHMNYETAMSMFRQRKGHRLSEWRWTGGVKIVDGRQSICDWIFSLPYMSCFLEAAGEIARLEG